MLVIFFNTNHNSLQTLEEVFALEGIISQDELQTLRPYTDVLRACTTANIDTWRDQKL